MEETCTYVDVVVPLPLEGTFTYSVPSVWAEKVQVGMRAVVPFGSRKIYTAIICKVHTDPPANVWTKDLLSLPDADGTPVVSSEQLVLWQRIASYYMMPLGEVYQTVVPAGLRPGSQTRVRINSGYEGDTARFTPLERALLELLSDGVERSVSALNRLAKTKNVLQHLNKLMYAGAVEMSEEVKKAFRPKMETYVRLADTLRSEDALQELFTRLKRAKKKLLLISCYIEISQFFASQSSEVTRELLLSRSGLSAEHLAELVKRGIFELYQKEASRRDSHHTSVELPPPLSSYQRGVYEQIVGCFRQKETVLLHESSFSDETTLYIHLAFRVLSEGKQVLFLLPEIALTEELIARFRAVFGPELAVFDSRLTGRERVEMWRNLQSDSAFRLILGVPAAIFLPLRRLGLVIIHREHVAAYKQIEPSCIQFRDMAVLMAGLQNARVLLTSATPSVESYANASAGKYGLVEIKRPDAVGELPQIVVANLKEAYRKRQMESHLTPELLESIADELRENRQVVLFQNRRGYASMLECRACSYVPRCPACGLTLTMHRAENQLVCHRCKFKLPLSSECPACGMPKMLEKGFGTERVEDELRRLFPHARTARLDADAIKTYEEYRKTLDEFEKKHIDILVGTQMLARGLPGEKPRLVGILNADNLMHFPHYKAHERAFQLLTSVATLCCGAKAGGKVILQSWQPTLPVIENVATLDYKQLFFNQMTERKLFEFPPFVRLVRLIFKHRQPEKLQRAAEQLAEVLRQKLQGAVHGPYEPAVQRKRDFYIKELMIKIKPALPREETKELIRKEIRRLVAQPAFRMLQIKADIDPE